MPKRKTIEQFIEEAKLIHGNKYDYSLVEYKNTFTKVKIICKEHGIFEQKPREHLYNKCGCPKCGLNKLKETFSKSEEKFIEELKEIYRDEYDYSKVKYKNSHTKVSILCKKHGEFKEKPMDLLYKKRGCKKCKLEKYIKDIELKENVNFREEYIKLIKAAKTDPPKHDFEIHHILPKSMFPLWKNRKSNLVKLSYEDHYKAHFYLYKIFNNYEMITAFTLMSKNNNSSSIKEAKRNRRRIVSKPVYCYELNKTFLNSEDAIMEIGLKGKSDMLKVCKNKLFTRTIKKYHWCYLENKEEAIKFWENNLLCLKEKQQNNL